MIHDKDGVDRRRMVIEIDTKEFFINSPDLGKGLYFFCKVLGHELKDDVLMYVVNSRSGRFRTKT